MIANAISFRHPSQRNYKTLPPPPSDLDDVIALIFSGPTPPTDDDFKQTHMLVGCKKVYEALSRLKLNHTDYADLNICIFEELDGLCMMRICLLWSLIIVRH